METISSTGRYPLRRPISLRMICAIHIRRCLYPDIDSAVDFLHLADSLKRFLNFNQEFIAREVEEVTEDRVSFVPGFWIASLPIFAAHACSWTIEVPSFHRVRDVDEVAPELLPLPDPLQPETEVCGCCLCSPSEEHESVE
eukprot:m.839227 g.839227  ORF g.839227 m.839227 type:complete len:141 (+) comp59503_c0_seq12:2518-2940(+)